MSFGISAASARMTSSYFSLMPTTARRAPTRSIAVRSPASIARLSCRISSLSLWRRGSHSAAFTMTTSALARSLTSVGNPAPPAPTTPQSSRVEVILAP